MQAYTFPTKNLTGLNHLQRQDLPVPELEPDDVLVKIAAVGLNPVDYKLMTSPPPTFSYPHIFGLDGAGTVVALGANVKNFKIGERVAGHNNLHRDGTFAEYAAFPAYCLAKVPDTVTFSTAAALLCGALTAYQALFRKLNLAGKRTILIHAGAGGVGSIAIQLAKLQNLRVLTTVSPGKKEFVATLHPDKIIDYHHENVTAEVLNFTNGEGVDLIVNTVGAAEAQLDLTERLTYNGALVCIVGTPTLSDPDFLEKNGLTVSSLNLGGAHTGHALAQKNDLGQMTADLLSLAREHKIDPCISEVLPFAELITGLTQLQEKTSIGKIIATL